MKTADHKIYLASKSPRRRELLRQIGIDFELLLLRSDGPRGADVTEEVLAGESALDYVARVSNEKAAFAWNLVHRRHLPPRPVLAADTTVTIDGVILGKPADRVEAVAMLQQLSGRTHQVLTSIAVHYQHFAEQRTQVSHVRFGVLSPAAIAAYCATPEPYDKAGGYGIQGSAALFVEHIEGSHSGIMGLPLYETAQLLKLAGLPLP
ncbi:MULTISPECIES: nucleoside triphosphate pyrophosphatase [unclassified Janthinobacterium]|uniref:dTTP/UTP pyrophosphatase n=1 Tax=Janthinobacterium lividum TaxID=29581 RepID=A0A1E8PTD0_9BURK|nr:nucleoside triphosphate pyrophosphatase [Janthinobacterium sp. CG_23.4]MDH6159352.1 septum formation protein [Janthinobacterium sp. CG_23.4]OFJ49568.1 septum formation protein Maf [Janthinobacterium lividum]